MALIKGSALAAVAKLFQFGQQATRGATDLDVDNVTQVLSINEIVRRSEAGGAVATGLFIGVLECDNGAGATNIEATIDPYNPGAAAGPGYPVSIDERFDVWILEVTGRRSAGTPANFTESLFGIDDPATHLAFGIDDAGSVITPLPVRSLVRFTDIEELTNTNNVLVDEVGQCRFNVTQRIRRGSILSYGCIASNAVTTRVQILMGLFPAGLGQDVAS